jgi:hypothetical protein
VTSEEPIQDQISSCENIEANVAMDISNDFQTEYADAIDSTAVHNNNDSEITIDVTESANDHSDPVVVCDSVMVEPEKLELDENMSLEIGDDAGNNPVRCDDNITHSSADSSTKKDNVFNPPVFKTIEVVIFSTEEYSTHTIISFDSFLN